MKKLFTIAIVALMAIGFVACNEKGASVKTTPLEDSLSEAMGNLYGHGMAGQLKQQDSTIKMEKVLKGIETILMADTSDHDNMAGIQAGLQITQLYSGIKQQMGIDINQKKFMKTFKESFMADSTMDQEQMMQLQQEMTPLMQRAQTENKDSLAKAGKLEALADSVTEAFAKMYGNGMAGSLKADSTLKMSKVFKGIEKVIKESKGDNSYTTGMQVGMQISQMFEGIKMQMGININQKKFMAAFKKALLDKKQPTQEELMQLQQNIQPMMERAAKEAKANDPKAIENKKAGEAFLNKKAQDKAYTKTASGLLYKVINEGNGANFTDNDVVMTKYVGKHIDGSEFDSSKDQAVPFNLKQVIPGFSEMLKLMKPGSKVEVIIPSELAYGDNGNQVIGPNEVLVFEIETVEAQKAPAAPAQPAK